MELKINPDFEPKFTLGQKVCYIKGREAVSAEIVARCYEEFQDKEGAVAGCVGYRLDHYRITDVSVDTFFPSRELYASERAVRAAVLWFPVMGISEEEWRAAIGNREDDDIEECELGVCCAKVSAARDLLLECKRDGGLIGRDRARLENCRHEHDESHPRPILDRVLAQLQIVW